MNRLSDRELENIVANHAASLVLYARQWCHSPDDAVQEALCELVSLGEVPPDPIAWLFKVVRYRALNIARSERRRESHHRACQEQRDSWFICNPDDPSQLDEVQGMLSELPDGEREVVVARVWGGLTFEQISELTHTSSSSVHRLYHRAMMKLKVRIDNPLESKK